MVKIYLVIPCYNEQEVLPETSVRLKEKITQLQQQGKISQDSRVLLVDDGSKDQTWMMIQDLHQRDSLFSGVRLSRNRGHQNALLAGLDSARGKADAVISLDADLQDDINAIDEFVDKFEEGYEVIYGVRSSRKKDSFFKKFTAEGFYHLMSFMGAEIVFNHADYRLLSNRALEGLFEFHEVNLFLRGLVPMVGYKSTEVYYERNERFAGESKYPLKKMIAFAFQGITSLSIKPIRLIITIGFIMFFISMLMLIYFIVQYFTNHTVHGWTSTVVSIWGIGGLQLLSIGVIGEYIGKVYLETKNRPKYIIDKFIHEENNDTQEKE